MRNKLIWACILVSGLLIAYLGFSIYKKIQWKRAVALNTGTLPEFSLLTLTNTVYTNTDLPVNNKIILNFYDPSCEYCQYMATAYTEHKEQLKNITVLMISQADSLSIAKFNKEYQLQRLPSIVLLRDTAFQSNEIFGVSTVPTFFVYEDHKLVKKIASETKIENLLGEKK